MPRAQTTHMNHSHLPKGTLEVHCSSLGGYILGGWHEPQCASHEPLCEIAHCGKIPIKEMFLESDLFKNVGFNLCYYDEVHTLPCF